METKFCVHCGQQLPIESVFCNKCGQKQPEMKKEPVPEKTAAQEAAPEVVSQPEPVAEEPVAPKAEVPAAPPAETAQKPEATSFSVDKVLAYAKKLWSKVNLSTVKSAACLALSLLLFLSLFAPIVTVRVYKYSPEYDRSLHVKLKPIQTLTLAVDAVAFAIDDRSDRAKDVMREYEDLDEEIDDALEIEYDHFDGVSYVDGIRKSGKKNLDDWFFYGLRCTILKGDESVDSSAFPILFTAVMTVLILVFSIILNVKAVRYLLSTLGIGSYSDKKVRKLYRGMLLFPLYLVPLFVGIKYSFASTMIHNPYADVRMAGFSIFLLILTILLPICFFVLDHLTGERQSIHSSNFGLRVTSTVMSLLMLFLTTASFASMQIKAEYLFKIALEYNHNLPDYILLLALFLIPTAFMAVLLLRQNLIYFAKESYYKRSPMIVGKILTSVFSGVTMILAIPLYIDFRDYCDKYTEFFDERFRSSDLSFSLAFVFLFILAIAHIFIRAKLVDKKANTDPEGLSKTDELL